MTDTFAPVHIIGGGLAGSEAAWQVASRGVPVVMHEMRPVRSTAAHKTGHLAELVCSNSFRSDDAQTSAIGLLHAEMRRLGSLVMRTADTHKLPAGSALAVDRDGFAAAVTAALGKRAFDRNQARGNPGASGRLGQRHRRHRPAYVAEHLPMPSAAATGEAALAFFDAIAPIVHREFIDFDIAWFQSRYDKAGPGGSGADYINCPLTRAQYDDFIDALLAGEKTAFREFEASTPYFDGCLPIEVMAERGRETPRHGPMKPFGLTDPRQPSAKPYAVVQLRQDNKLGTLFNMVGFQTKLKHGEQVRILRTIPALANAEFARLGGLHRNTFLNSPNLLDATLRLKAMPRLRFAGQITGCEGYVESAAIGLLAGRFAGGGTARRSAPNPAADHRAWRPPRSHYRRTRRSAGCRQSFVSTDERQFRTVSAASVRARAAATGKKHCPSAHSPISSSGPAPPFCTPRNRFHRAIRSGLRAARQISHCRRHCGISAG